jgi:hypothetical protein
MVDLVAIDPSETSGLIRSEAGWMSLLTRRSFAKCEALGIRQTVIFRDGQTRAGGDQEDQQRWDEAWREAALRGLLRRHPGGVRSRGSTNLPRELGLSRSTVYR